MAISIPPLPSLPLERLRAGEGKTVDREALLTTLVQLQTFLARLRDAVAELAEAVEGG